MLLPDLLSFVWTHPLNAGDKAAALGPVVRWQVASRLMAGPIAVPFVEGTSLFVTKRMTGATGNWYCGLHEVRDMAFVLHVLRPSEHFLDVGANLGSYTVLAGGGLPTWTATRSSFAIERRSRTGCRVQSDIDC